MTLAFRFKYGCNISTSNGFIQRTDGLIPWVFQELNDQNLGRNIAREEAGRPVDDTDTLGKWTDVHKKGNRFKRKKQSSKHHFSGNMLCLAFYGFQGSVHLHGLVRRIDPTGWDALHRMAGLPNFVASAIQAKAGREGEARSRQRPNHNESRKYIHKNGSPT